MNEVKAVYKAIINVMADISKEGIPKVSPENKGDKGVPWKYRKIDDMYNVLCPMLAEHKLMILPKVLERSSVERTSAKENKALFFTTIKVLFTLVSAEDGSSHEVITYGEAMDNSDKSTNKAMSAALKYACLQCFMIPTEGDNDADATNHEVLPKEDNKEDAAKRKEAVDIYTKISTMVSTCPTVESLNLIKKHNEDLIARSKELSSKTHAGIMQLFTEKERKLTLNEAKNDK